MQRIKDTIESILEDVKGIDSETIEKVTDEVEEHLIAGFARLVITREAADQFVEKHGGTTSYLPDGELVIYTGVYDHEHVEQTGEGANEWPNVDWSDDDDIDDWDDDEALEDND